MHAQLKKAGEAHRRAVEALYEDSCTVYEYRPSTDDRTKLTTGREVLVCEGIPCKLSFGNISPTSSDGNAARQDMSVKLFLSPEQEIRSGSKIVVRHLGTETVYGCSGVPAVYPTHQEIELQLWERWA